MSHFTVLVQMTNDFVKKHGDVQSAVGVMLAPYQENNMGNCPQEYLEFNDMTDEIKESAQEVIEPDSYMSEIYPDYVGKTIEEALGGFSQVAEEHCGYRQSGPNGEYGYWENPNAKWDWWSIGGRWRESLRIKESSQSHVRGNLGVPELMSINKEGKQPSFERYAADGAQKQDIDLEGMDLEIQSKIDAWWEKYLEYKNTDEDKGHPAFYGIQFDMMQMGLTEVVQETVIRRSKAEKELREHCEKTGDKNHDLVDKLPPVEYITKDFTKEDIEKDYRWHFEFSTYAVLTKDGLWQAKGEMGWFGLSSDDATDRQDWGNSFVDKFIHSADDTDWFVVVDCHI